MKRKGWAPVALAGVLLFGVVACAEQEVSVERWADDVCDALGTWQEDLEEASTEIEGALEADDLEDAQDDLVEGLDDAHEATDDMIREIEDAGFPDVEDGEELADRFVEELERLEQDLEDARDAAEELDPDEPSQFREGAEDLERQLNESSDRPDEAFEALEEDFETGALERAFQEEEDCQEL